MGYEITSGIEIHQQIDADKLFSRAPSTICDAAPDIIVERLLAATAGEGGAVDIAALQETEKGLKFIYEGYSDSTSLVEFDEEPPQQIDSEALRTTLKVAKILDALPVDIAQVMRKTVIDGSNTSGFQRTALIARDGILKLSFGDVSIPTICLEEESARIMRREKDKVVYRLDRLGIPLIEIATGPDMHTPEQVKEAAETLGMILRSTRKVRRGLGTIRQDVNVSIPEGTRVEIKGVQDLKMIPLFVDLEANRQRKIVSLMDRFGACDCGDAKELTELFKNTLSKIILSADSVWGLRIANASGILGLEVAPGKRVGSELSDYAKIKSGVGGLIHSDENITKYKISHDELSAVKSALDISKSDAFILIADNSEKAVSALKAVSERMEQLKCGVPSEVRKANADGTTSYLRPMPGSARMYPETDVPPFRLSYEGIEIPRLITDEISELCAQGLSQNLAKLIVKHESFLKLFKKLKLLLKSVGDSFIAEKVVSSKHLVEKELSTNLRDSDYIEGIEEVFFLLDSGKIVKSAFDDALLSHFKTGSVDLDVLGKISEKDVKSVIKKLLVKNPSLGKKQFLGLAFAKLRLRADADAIKKEVSYAFPNDELSDG